MLLHCALTLLGMPTPQVPAAHAAAAAPLTATLHPGDLRGGGLRWSPKAASVPLTAEAGTLRGAIEVGPKGAAKVAVRLEKTAGAAHYDRIWIDLDRDGETDADEVLTAKVSEQRGKWWSSADAPLTVLDAGAAGNTTARPYPIAMWFVEDPQEPDAAPALRWTRRGWHEGTCTIDGKPAFVLLAEMHLDGVFDQRDAWALTRDAAALRSAAARGLESHCWLDGVAYRMTAIAADGASLRFESFDPGFTEAEERERNDSTAVDRRAPRAAAPLQFGGDLTAALVAAKASGKKVFVDFQTTWCGPCRAMEQHVYTAAEVVDAAAKTIAVKLDGDEQRELAKRYQVTAYPTMLLLDAEGNELKRLVGYQHVRAMAAFLADAK